MLKRMQKGKSVQEIAINCILQQLTIRPNIIRSNRVDTNKGERQKETEREKRFSFTSTSAGDLSSSGFSQVDCLVSVW